MLLRLSGDIRIEDRWNHPSETVEELRALLAGGVEASPEPHRQNFYEIRNGFHIFYVHICPTGKVLLLAIWPAELQFAQQAANLSQACSSI
jgi:hypothetical protein